MILDGWGKSPDPKVSAIENANTPFVDSLYKTYANANLLTDGMNVGLPEGQMGNSEVGHMNLGAGRIVYQDLAKINLAIKENTLKDEPVLKEAFRYAKEQHKSIHFLGLVSDGGVHSHITHLKGLIEASNAYGVQKAFVHVYRRKGCGPKKREKLSNGPGRVLQGKKHPIGDSDWPLLCHGP